MSTFVLLGDNTAGNVTFIEHLLRARSRVRRRSASNVDLTQVNFPYGVA